MSSEIKVDTVSEKTSANGITIDGLNIKDAKLVTANSVIEANMSANSVDSDSYVDGSIDTAHIADLNVTTGKIAADAITGAKIADDAINSEHYTDGSIDTAHLADGQVTIGKLATAVLTGATDIGAAIADADLLLVDDGAGGTLRKTAASRLKTYVGQNTPYFHVYKSGDQTISNASFTTVTFDSEEFDSGSAFASNTFTAPSTGYYFFYSQLVWSGSTDSNYSLNRLMKNGTAINWNAFFQTESSGGFGGRVIGMSATDTMIVQCYQDSGGNLALRGSGEDECQFGGYKLIT